jgi:nitroimidazol reductase NimA-like FMN-containing flavoprotein (pyridoxamine 5'-phosphate oxidase superfamily)
MSGALGSVGPQGRARRKDRVLPENEAWGLLEGGEFGTLAMCAPNGGAHAVALNYVVRKGSLYFHCAHEGYKIDCLRSNAKVCFSVVLQCQVLPDVVSTAYKSVTVYGEAALVDEISEKHAALAALMRKYTPMSEEEADAYAQKRISEPAVIRMSVDVLSGKCRPLPQK